MDLVVGYLKHSRKTKPVWNCSVSEVYVCDISTPCRQDEYMVSDGNGNIPIVKYIVENEHRPEFLGCFKYRLGSIHARKFYLLEGRGKDMSLSIDGKCFHIHSECSDDHTMYLIFFENQLQAPKVGFSKDFKEEELSLEFSAGSTEDSNALVLSFLKQTDPVCHSQFLHFCFSNVSAIHGQTFASYSDNLIVYHTVISSVFLNFNELFSNVALLQNVVNVPYFPHSSFVINLGRNRVYESKEYTFQRDYPKEFILNVLSLVLQEERLMFYSTKRCVLQVLGILDLLRPFKWPHILCLPLLAEMEEILNSPFPFIACLDRKLEIDGTTLVDLDSLKIYGSGRLVSPFRNSIWKKASSDIQKLVKDRMNSIATDILSKREEKIKKCNKNELDRVINDPGALFGGKRRTFYSAFSKTRMFLTFVAEDRNHPCRYMVKLGQNPEVTLLPQILLTNKLEVRVLKLWIELFDGEMGAVIEYLRKREMLEIVAESVLKRLSYNKDYEKIHDVLSCIQNPTREMYMNINVVQQIPKIRFTDIHKYAVYHLRACCCRALIFCNTQIGTHVSTVGSTKPMCTSTLGGISDCSESTSKGATRQRIKALLGEIKQDIFDLENMNCYCKVEKTSILLVEGPDRSFLCSLLTPENIRISLQFPSRNTPQLITQVYWSTVIYYLYFNLPLSWYTLNESVDVVVEEFSLPGIQINRKPKVYFNP